MISDDQVFGLFQQFRPLGKGVERVFYGVPKGPQYVARLLSVYAATSHADWACDTYFVVREPITTTPDELRGHGRALVEGLRQLARVIGQPELLTYLQSAQSVEMVPRTQLKCNNDENLLVGETIGDWVILRSDCADYVPQLREAFYSVACDFFLMYFLQWPYFEKWCGQDVFLPYFELWCRGAACAFEGPTLKIGVPGLK